MAKSKAETAPTASEPRSLESLQALASSLQALYDGVETHGSGEHAATIAAATALSREIRGVHGELRQLAKAEARAVESIPLDKVVAYLRTLPMKQRAQIAREVSGEQDEDGLL